MRAKEPQRRRKFGGILEENSEAEDPTRDTA